jgi:hypothetical protein
VFHRNVRALVNLPLHRLLVPPQHLFLVTVLKITVLDIEQNLDFPWTKRVPIDVAAQQLSYEFVELHQDDFAVFVLADHTYFFIG